jgi:hypothetical protein
MNAQVAGLARSDNAMIDRNLVAARTTLAHATGIEANLDHIRPASGTAASLNQLIEGESAKIAAINAAIRHTFDRVNATSHAIHLGVRRNNVRNAAILAASRATAHNQAATAVLQRKILAHVASTECSPLIRACGAGGVPAHLRHEILNGATRARTGTAPHPAGNRPTDRARPTAAPQPVSATPTPSSDSHPILPLPLRLPLLGALEVGAAASGASGAAATAIAIARRRRRRR